MERELTAAKQEAEMEQGKVANLVAENEEWKKQAKEVLGGKIQKIFQQLF